MNTQLEYLKRHVYLRLSNVNDGYDVPGIYYFKPHDFAVVLQRVQELGIGINGIEVWRNKQPYGVLTSYDYNLEPHDLNWYIPAFMYFEDLGLDLTYSASFEIPYELILGDFN